MSTTTSTATWQTLASAPIGSRVLVAYYGSRVALWTNQAKARCNPEGYAWGTKIEKDGRDLRVRYEDGTIRTTSTGTIRCLVEAA